MSAAVPIATTSAPSAIALARSAEERIEPAATIDAWLRMPSSRSRWSTTAIAISIGMPMWSRMIGRRRAGAALEAVEVDVVGAGAHDARRDGGDVVHRRDLDADRLVAATPP